MSKGKIVKKKKRSLIETASKDLFNYNLQIDLLYGKSSFPEPEEIYYQDVFSEEEFEKIYFVSPNFIPSIGDECYGYKSVLKKNIYENIFKGEMKDFWSRFKQYNIPVSIWHRGEASRILSDFSFEDIVHGDTYFIVIKKPNENISKDFVIENLPRHHNFNVNRDKLIFFPQLFSLNSLRITLTGIIDDSKNEILKVQTENQNLRLEAIEILRKGVDKLLIGDGKKYLF
jgi:hypothetical protein